MKRTLLFAVCAVLATVCVAAPKKKAPLPKYKDASLPTEERIEDLIGRMTVDEKVGQLLCPLGWPMYDKTVVQTKKGTKTELSLTDLFKKRMAEMPLGSLWAIQRADPWTQKTLETGIGPEESARLMNILQRYAVEETRLGIPVMIMEEAPHGHMGIGSTTFPTGLGQAATFDTALMERMGTAIGKELSLRGAHIAYGPVLDIAREPRWSRMEETFGEDPYLAGQMGAAVVRGVRGQGVWNTLKHFAAYGIPEGGLNGEQVQLGMNHLLNCYLPQFHTAVQNGAGSIMTSYNSIDGVPCTANKTLLTDMLRNEWDFRGFVISDLLSIDGVAQTHNVATDRAEAAAMALKAGVDIDLDGHSYEHLKTALERGLVTMDDIDRAVRQVLRTKYELGLFDNPYVDVAAAKQVHNADHRQLARQIARESVVMLKNDGTLPLSKATKSIAVIGPNADVQYNQLGDYTAPQADDDIVTVLEGIRAAVPSAEVRYVKGCAIRDTQTHEIEKAVEAARQSDVTVLVVGGSSARDFKTSYGDTGAAKVDITSTELPDMDCGEGYDRATLELLGHQLPLMQALLDAKVKLVVVYIQGRTLDMNLASNANALLCAWYPGEQGGNGVADVLFGDYNPSGRLPVSVQRNVGQLPVYYTKRRSHDYIDSQALPLYPFGYGLSYTTFAYKNATATTAADGTVKVECDVTNTGNTEGDEVAQLYLDDVTTSIWMPHNQLKGFFRLHLKPGETQRVAFTLGQAELGIVNSQRQLVVEPGKFKAYVGGSSQLGDSHAACEFTIE